MIRSVKKEKVLNLGMAYTKWNAISMKRKEKKQLLPKGGQDSRVSRYDSL